MLTDLPVLEAAGDLYAEDLPTTKSPGFLGGRDRLIERAIKSGVRDAALADAALEKLILGGLFRVRGTRPRGRQRFLVVEPPVFARVFGKGS